MVIVVCEVEEEMSMEDTVITPTPTLGMAVLSTPTPTLAQWTGPEWRQERKATLKVEQLRQSDRPSQVDQMPQQSLFSLSAWIDWPGDFLSMLEQVPSMAATLLQHLNMSSAWDEGSPEMVNRHLNIPAAWNEGFASILAHLLMSLASAQIRQWFRPILIPALTLMSLGICWWWKRWQRQRKQLTHRDQEETDRHADPALLQQQGVQTQPSTSFGDNNVVQVNTTINNYVIQSGHPGPHRRRSWQT